MNNQSQMIISIDAEKEFDKLQQTIMINNKTLKKLDIERTYLKMTELAYNKPIYNIMNETC